MQDGKDICTCIVDSPNMVIGVYITGEPNAWILSRQNCLLMHSVSSRNHGTWKQLSHPRLMACIVIEGSKQLEEPNSCL